MANPLPIIWTSHLANSPKEKAELEDTIRNNTVLLERLRSIIEEKEGSLYRSEIALSSYDKEGWAYKQAHLNGRRAVYEEIRQILTI